MTPASNNETKMAGEVRSEPRGPEPPEPFCGNCDDLGSYTCTRCDGEGVVLVCIDDICRGRGECMHGDGEALCRACNGSGEIDCLCGEGGEASR